MGVEVTTPPAIDRLCARVSTAVASLLDQDERAIVEGDLAESRAGGLTRLIDVGGLVLRRRVADWLDWRPWLAVLTIALPLGFVLSHTSREWSESFAVYGKLYIVQWTWSYLEYPGSRQELLTLALQFTVEALALMVWSWSAGYAFTSVSRRTAWISFAVFAVTIFIATVGSDALSRRLYFDEPLFFLPRHLVRLPRLVRVGLVLLPAWRGLRRAQMDTPLTRWQAVLAAGALVTITVLASSPLEGSLVYPLHTGPLPLLSGPDGLNGTWDDPRSLIVQLLPVLMIWPGLYAAAHSAWSRRRRAR